jgi:hypothetical protein
LTPINRRRLAGRQDGSRTPTTLGHTTEPPVLEIAVNVQDAAAWTPGVEYAAGLAAAANASFTGFHAPPARPLLESLPEDVRPPGVNGASADRRLFREHAKGRGVPRAAWQVVEGYLPDILAHACNWLDVFVLERNPDMAWGTPAKIGQLVLASGGACVIAPASGAATSASNAW